MDTLDRADYYKLLDDYNFRKIIFFDTCSLFDILRLHSKIHIKEKGTRLQNHKSYYELDDFKALREIKKNIENKTITPVFSTAQSLEIKRNYDTVVQELKLNKIKYNFFLETVVADTGLALSTNSGENILDELTNIFNVIVTNAISLNYDSQIITNAYSRVSTKTLPSRSNKKDINDSIIWDTYLELIKLPNKHSTKIVFLTSNTEDFILAEGPIPRLGAELQDLKIHNIVYTFNEAVSF